MKRFSWFASAVVALSFVAMLFTSPVLAAKPAPAGKINLNQATAQQLTALPGVGPKLAERIVDYRQKQGGFHSAQELLNVQGIGEKNLAKLQPFVVVSGDGAKAEAKTDAKAAAR